MTDLLFKHLGEGRRQGRKPINSHTPRRAALCKARESKEEDATICASEWSSTALLQTRPVGKGLGAQGSANCKTNPKPVKSAAPGVFFGVWGECFADPACLPVCCSRGAPTFWEGTAARQRSAGETTIRY